MKDITKALMQQFRREHKAARRYIALLLALALLTSLFVNWQLHSVGIAQTADYQCGEIEHQHTAECYEKVLVCGYDPNKGYFISDPYNYYNRGQVHQYWENAQTFEKIWNERKVGMVLR